MIDSKDFNDREVKYASLNLESINEKGEFEGYASLFNTLDLSKDIVIKGAFEKGLKHKSPLAIKMLYQHNPSKPIGVWQMIKEDHKGLYVKGKLLKEIQRAKEVWALMKQGALDGLSIGYKTVRSRSINKGTARQLLEIELYEISIVTFPMHPDARVQTIKTLPVKNGLPTIRDFERWLMRDAGFTRREAQTAIAKGFKSLAIMRDAECENGHQSIKQIVPCRSTLSEKILRAKDLFTQQ